MEEQKIVKETPAKESTLPEKKTGNPGYEPHGGRSAGRPGDRKFGDRKGRPSERRGGRGGFRREDDNMSDRVVYINRVSRTESGGKHMRFDALVVVGDGKGHYGFAMKKSGEVPDAIKKSLTQAKKHMHYVHIVKGGTIAHEVVGVYGSTKVFLKPAPVGTGIVAGGSVRAMVELAGFKNISSKVYGSRTPVNVIRATDKALQSLKEYNKIMVLRGKKNPEDFKKTFTKKTDKKEEK